MLARNAVKNSLKEIPAESHIGFGCSGGADSMALLFALSTLYHGDRANLVHVVIVNHQLQEITDEISQNTSEIALSYGFIPHIVPVDVVSTNKGMESDAREARYEAFNKIIEEQNLQAFLIGHTKTDQAEQVLLGMLRGSGTRSVSGIPEKRNILMRPFLNLLSRTDTQNVCNENNYDYWCDPQNDSDDYRRVIARKMISGIEESTGQNIVDSLVRTSQINTEDADALDFYADMAFEKILNSDWNVNVLSGIPTAVRKRAYRKMILELGAESDSIGFDLTNRVDEFVTNWRGQGAVNFSNGVKVYRENKNLVFSI